MFFWSKERRQLEDERAERQLCPGAVRAQLVSSEGHCRGATEPRGGRGDGLLGRTDYPPVYKAMYLKLTLALLQNALF